MIRTVARVVRGEGTASAIRRSGERIREAVAHAAMRTAGVFAGRTQAEILNVCAGGISPRRGGVAIQLVARLREESASRIVALLHPGGLRLSAPFPHVRGIRNLREALAITGARTAHFEGTSEVPLETILELIASGMQVVVSVHDFSLFCARPHLLEEPMQQFCGYSLDLDRCDRCLRPAQHAPSAQAERRRLARRVLETATALVFPSRFMLEKHRELFSLPLPHAAVIEPPCTGRTHESAGTSIAFAGSVQRHKGAHLLPEIARLLALRDLGLHVFGGGDADLLLALRRLENVFVHGYYRAGTLPMLLERHRIGLVLLPSIVPEAYSLTLSETWLAGAIATAFDHGAIAERIRQNKGGFLAPLDSGAAGLVEIIDRWKRDPASPRAEHPPAAPQSSASATVEIYRRCGALPAH